MPRLWRNWLKFRVFSNQNLIFKIFNKDDFQHKLVIYSNFWFQLVFPTSVFISNLIWIVSTDLKTFELFIIPNFTFQSIRKPGKRDYEFRKKYPESKLDLMRTQPMRTLLGIMRELEHTDRIIDVVKIDREGPRKAYEPAVIRNLLEDGTYRYIEFYLNV